MCSVDSKTDFTTDKLLFKLYYRLKFNFNKNFSDEPQPHTAAQRGQVVLERGGETDQVKHVQHRRQQGTPGQPPLLKLHLLRTLLTLATQSEVVCLVFLNEVVLVVF